MVRDKEGAHQRDQGVLVIYQAQVVQLTRRFSSKFSSLSEGEGVAIQPTPREHVAIAHPYLFWLRIRLITKK